MTLVDPEDYEKIAEGDSISIIGFKDAIAGSDALTLVTEGGTRVELSLSLTDRQRKIILAGGLLNYTKDNQKG